MENKTEIEKGLWDINYKTLIAMFLFPILFVLCLIGNFNETLRYIEYSKWPSTTGTILNTKITERQYEAKNRIHYQYIPDVYYRYSVDGYSFTNNIVNPFDEGIGTIEYASEYIGKYKEGSKVTVYYSKANPQASFLEKNMNGRTKGNYFLTLFCLIVSIVLWRFWKKLIYF